MTRYPAIVVIALAALSASACSAKTPSSSTPPTPATVTVTEPAAAQAPAASSTAEPAAPSTTSPATVTVAATPVMPNVVHLYLDSAHKLLTAAGVADAYIGDSTLGENQVVILESNWIVLTQTPAAGTKLASGQLVHLGVVKTSDPKAAGITPRG